MWPCAASATAEDVPDASFAGQQETFLNGQWTTALRDACRRCFGRFHIEWTRVRAEPGAVLYEAAERVRAHKKIRVAVVSGSTKPSITTDKCGSAACEVAARIRKVTYAA